MLWLPSVSSWKRGRWPFWGGPQGRSMARPPPTPTLAQAGSCVLFQESGSLQTPGPGDPTVREPAYFFLEKTS